MGYGAAIHMKAIKKYGVTQFHRKTFKPCCGKEFILKKGIKQIIDDTDEEETIENQENENDNDIEELINNLEEN